MLAATGDASTQAMGNGLLLGAALTALAAVIVARYLPGRKAADTSRSRIGDHASAVSEHS